MFFFLFHLCAGVCLSYPDADIMQQVCFKIPFQCVQSPLCLSPQALYTLRDIPSVYYFCRSSPAFFSFPFTIFLSCASYSVLQFFNLSKLFVILPCPPVWVFAGLFVSLLSSLQFYDARVHVGTSVLNGDRQTNQNPYGAERIHLFLGYANEVTLAENRHHLRMRGMISP